MWLQVGCPAEKALRVTRWNWVVVISELLMKIDELKTYGIGSLAWTQS